MKKFFNKGDIDGFFGLFIDNLLQLMIIYVLCSSIMGFEHSLLIGIIFPGAALSILLGNLFYSHQAKKLMEKEGRDDVTALPYGINTPSVFAFIFFIMVPIYFETLGGGATKEEARNLAWKAGLFACFVSGLMEVARAFIGNTLRRKTPRAALLAPLAGIAITFICMGFVFKIFNNPVIALVPMFLIIIAYAARISLPLKLPGGMVAIIAGLATAYISKALGYQFFEPFPIDASLSFHPPTWSGGDLFSVIGSEKFWGYMAIIFPMGLFNIVGSLQNLESAEAAGDSFETLPSLLTNGLGTVAASLFGSPFPTTIYIGHPGWKNMGAKANYSTMNGVLIAVLCLIGGLGAIIKYVPMEVVLGIILWIGIIIMAQCHQDSPPKHYLAIALGLVPCLAAWAFILINSTAIAAGKSLFELKAELAKGDIFIDGVISLNQGFLVTSMIYAATTVFIIERKFLHAAGWITSAAVLSFFGVIHAFELTKAEVKNVIGVFAAPQYTFIYFILAALLLGLHYYCKHTGQLNTETSED